MNVTSLQSNTDRKKLENNRKNLKNLKSSERRKRNRRDGCERDVKHRKRNRRWLWKEFRRRMIL